MSIAFSTLLSRLQTAVAARDGVPSSGQYDQAIRDAVSDFNNRATRLTSSLISIVSGTADYTLPADFWKFVDLVTPLAIGEVVVTDVLTPLPLDGKWSYEEYTINGGQLHIYPTPTYTLDRRLRYGAGFIESGSPSAYAAMTEREAAIVLLLAQSLARGHQEVAEASGVTSYKQGDVAVSFSGAGVNLKSESESLLGRYEAAVAAYIGSITRQA